MMRNGKWILVVLVLILSVPSIVKADLYYPSVQSNCNMYADGSTEDFISISVVTETDEHEVYATHNVAGKIRMHVTITHFTEDGIPYYEYGGRIITDPSSFSNYGGEYLIESSDGSSTTYIQDPNRLSAMDYVSDAKITGGKQPTITWSAVENTDLYKVRFYTDQNAAYLESHNVEVDAGDTYQFKYEGDLFDTYDSLYIAIEARDYDYTPKTLLQNKSKTYYNYTPAPLTPSINLLLQVSD